MEVIKELADDSSPTNPVINEEKQSVKDSFSK